MKDWFLKFQKTVAGGAAIIASFTILARLLGLLRDRFLSSFFGAGEILDAYYAAFRLPDLIFNTLVLGALASSFIPIFLEEYSKDKNEAWRLTNGVLNLLVTIIALSIFVLFIFTPVLTKMIVPGFSLEAKLLTTKLTRIMLIGILFFTISNILSGILNSFRKFFAYSLAPCFYNLGIIFGILFLVPFWGPNGLAWGVVIGSFLHFLIQLPAALNLGYRYRLIFNFFHPQIKKIIRLMIPRCFGLAVSQFNLIITTFIASGVVVGAVAIYNLAFNIASAPMSIFAISLATSVFPVFSQAFINGHLDEFRGQFVKTTGRILYLTIPITFTFIFLRVEIVRLILGAGKFSPQDIILTSQTLAWFSLSLWAHSLLPLLARSFYARQDTITPVKAALAGLAVNLIGCLILSKFMGVAGLSLALSLSIIVNLVILFVLLSKKVENLGTRKIFFSSLKILFISILMTGFVLLIKEKIGFLVDLNTFFGLFWQVLIASGGGLIIYFLLSLLFRCQEIEGLTKIFKSL